LQPTVDDDLPELERAVGALAEALPADEEVGEVSIADGSSEKDPRADISPSG